MNSNFFLFIIFLIGIASCPSQVQKQNEATNPTDKRKILIVYLTRTGNTEAIAKMIREKVGGDSVSLELENPYPKDYQAIVRQVDEENERGFLPPLKTKIENIRQYDTIFSRLSDLGYAVAAAGEKFLNQYDLSGKMVIPFNTNAGYGAGSSFGQVKQFAPESMISKGFEIKGGIERDGILFVMEGEKEIEARSKVNEWLQEIKILQSVEN